MFCIIFYPDLTAMKFNNAFYKCQPDLAAFRVGIQFIEQTEYTLMILGFDADPVTAHKEQVSFLCD